MILTSPIFEDGGGIPVKYTCDGGGINPELQVQNVPEEAQSLALIMHDPDAPDPKAPRPGGFTHWVVWNINPRTELIKTESVPPGGIEGENSAGKASYAAPCPHIGRHRYVFHLYALRIALDLPAGSPVAEVKKNIEKNLITEATLTGTYQR